VIAELLERRLAHRVRVVHGGTLRPYDRIDARLTEPAWPHWSLRVRGADILLSAEVRWLADEPAATTVEVEVADPAVRERFAAGGAASVDLAGGADFAVTLVLQPQPVVLEVVLVGPDGSARPGRTVRARGNGHTVDLTAPAGSNVYRSAPSAWEPAQQPYAIHVNDNRRGTAALDFTRPVTRVRVIDP